MSDLSDAESNLSDEESSFYANTSAEISRISKKHGKNRMRSSSVQTDESDVDDVREQSSAMSKSHIECSADESVSSKKKKLLEEYVPADGEDPKFEIPPESLEVPEGEPAKFSLRFAGTEPISELFVLLRAANSKKNCNVFIIAKKLVTGYRFSKNINMHFKLY